MTTYGVIEAPSNLGLRPTGVETLPDALLSAGLLRRLKASRAGRVEAAAYEAMIRLALDHLDGFWIHLDVDVLDDAIMPAVDYRMPAGLSWSELEIVLRTALRSGKAVGLEVTIFNPRLDLDGHIARDLVASLAAAMT